MLVIKLIIKMTEENVFRSSMESISDISQDFEPVAGDESTKEQLRQALEFMKGEYESLNR